MKRANIVVLVIFVCALSGCRRQDVTMWGNAEVKDGSQGRRASYYVVGSKNGEPHVAVVIVQTPDIPALRFNVSLSTKAIIVNGETQPLPNGFVVFVNTRHGEIRSFPGDGWMREVLRGDHDATMTELIKIVGGEINNNMSNTKNPPSQNQNTDTDSDKQ